MKTSADTYALQPGTALHGRRTYVIEGVLGVGGFGITYLASTTFTLENLQTKGYVAIKEHFMSDHCERIAGSTKVVVSGTAKIRELVANARKDFLAEARRLAQLGGQHNNIVRVNEVFEGNGTAYFVMEYLDGRSLQQFIADNGPLGEDTLRGIMAPVVDAVAFLHRNRFTHLDIKPDNIMLTATPYGGIRPVLIDFGLSKHYDEHGNATSAINTCGASDGYAPVEQYQGIRTFSPTADVYALGATMLACATGQRPAASANWMPGEPATSIAALPLSPQLRQAMTVALSQSPHSRYPDAGALLTAIGGGGGSETHAFVQHTPKPDTSTRALPRAHPAKPGSKKWFFLAIALVAVLLAGAAYVFMDRDRVEEYAPDTDASSQAMTDAWWAARRTPHNLELAVYRGGNKYYLSRADYNNLSPSQKPGMNKVGVVVMGNDENGRRQSFILALDDLIPEEIDWNEAMRRYGNSLPTKDQAYVWAHQREVIKSAINDFGGSGWPEEPWYWTKTEESSSGAWVVGMFGGYIHPYSKLSTGNVRAVAAVPGS